MITFSKLGFYGRLGNQLFQIASTIGIALKNNTIPVFQDWIYKKFFECNPDYFKSNLNLLQFTDYNEPRFEYDEVKGDNFNLLGYFQSEKYWLHCKGLILKFLTFNKASIGWTPHENMNKDFYERAVAIHIRRGDYLTKSEYHTNLRLSYYIDAIKLYLPDVENIVIFTDDQDYCKTLFNIPALNDNYCLILSLANETQDLFWLSKFKYFVIANSSFSWWGAYLSAHADKKIIAPKNWFGYAYTMGINDLIPQNNQWLVI